VQGQFRKFGKMNPLVSVIIPTFNRAGLLKRAIESVLNQQYQNFEIIIIDESSEHDSEEVVKSFSQDCITYVKCKQREGVAVSRNMGIKLSKGKYVAFLDDDDEWLPNKLLLQVELLEKSSDDVGVVHGNCFVDFGTKRAIFHEQDYFDQSTVSLLKTNFIANSTCLLKKKCFSSVGYHDEELSYCEDWDLYVRFSKKFKFLYIHQPVAILHWSIPASEGRASQNLRRVTKGYQLFFAKHWQDYRGNSQVLSKNLWYIGLNLNALEEKDLAKWYFLKAYLLCPRNILPLLSFCFYGLKFSIDKIGFVDLLGGFANDKLLHHQRIGNK
jgi:glycosyltransferase involved in cell wall biosynthesis